jgi:sporulation protein YqfC
MEGCTGVLKYSSDNIKVNTNSMVVSIQGRGLNLKCISSSSLVISGTVLSVEFIM